MEIRPFGGAQRVARLTIEEIINDDDCPCNSTLEQCEYVSMVTLVVVLTLTAVIAKRFQDSAWFGRAATGEESVMNVREDALKV